MEGWKSLFEWTKKHKRAASSSATTYRRESGRAESTTRLYGVGAVNFRHVTQVRKPEYAEAEHLKRANKKKKKGELSGDHGDR
jgi:hypothetical protein